MNLYLWRGVANNWGKGAAVAIAPDVEAARKVALEALRRHTLARWCLKPEDLEEGDPDELACVADYRHDAALIQSEMPTMYPAPFALIFRGSE
jgi:hypothetical protein